MLGRDISRSYVVFPFVLGVLEPLFVVLKSYVKPWGFGDAVRISDIFGGQGGGSGGVTGRSDGRALCGCGDTGSGDLGREDDLDRDLDLFLRYGTTFGTWR